MNQHTKQRWPKEEYAKDASASKNEIVSFAHFSGPGLYAHPGLFLSFMASWDLNEVLFRRKSSSGDRTGIMILYSLEKRNKSERNVNNAVFGNFLF